MMSTFGHLGVGVGGNSRGCSGVVCKGGSYSISMRILFINRLDVTMNFFFKACVEIRDTAETRGMNACFPIKRR